MEVGQQCQVREKNDLLPLLATHHFIKDSKRLLYNISHVWKGNVNRDCPFIKLPIDIIRYIVDFLPLSAQASLALTAKSLCYAVGNQSWKDLGQNHIRARHNWVEYAERENFLWLLERDLAADLFYCPGCFLLHPKSALRPIRGDFHYVQCKALTTYVYNRRYLALSWAHVHLVMQRHFRGKDFGLPLDTLSTRYKTPWYKLANVRNVRSFEMQGRIVLNNLIVKRTYVIDVFRDEALYHLKVCNHLRIGTGQATTLLKDDEFMDRIRCRLSHLESSCKYCHFCHPQTRRCRWCAVEYDFHVKQSLYDTRLKIEAWVNFGSGEDLEDPIWTGERVHDPLVEIFDYQRGDVRKMYESGHFR